MKPSIDIESAKRIFSQLMLLQPKQAKVTVGVDIGSVFLKIIALGAGRGTKSRPIVGKVCIELPKDPDERASTIKMAFETLKLSGTKVCVGLSGPSVIMRVIEMPTMNLDEMKQALPFEAERYLPFSVQDVEIDGCVLGPSAQKKSWVLVAACKKSYVKEQLEMIKQTGLEPALIDVDALALTNSFLSQSAKRDAKSTCALLNVGAEFTNVVVFRGEMPYLLRDIPWGSRRLFKELSDSLGLPVDKVQTAIEESEVSEEGEETLKTYTEALVSELQLSFDYFENQFGRPPEDIFVSGGLSHSEVLLKTLSEHLAQQVSAWSPQEGLENQFTVAYGLALRRPL